MSLPLKALVRLSHPSWKQAMTEEMIALYSNGTWELVALPPNKSPVGCRWVYIVNVGPDGEVDWLKARLFKGTLNNMARTIMILFLLWLRLLLFVCFFLWLLCAHDPFFNWISRMPSFMVISQRRFIWSNRLVLLLRRSLVWYANHVVPYMV